MKIMGLREREKRRRLGDARGVRQRGARRRTPIIQDEGEGDSNANTKAIVLMGGGNIGDKINFIRRK